MHKGNGQDWQPDYPRTYQQDYYNGDFVFRYYEFHYKSKMKIHKDKENIIYRVYDSYYENTQEGKIEVDEIKYVHQLQNLYFALTGQELTL